MFTTTAEESSNHGLQLKCSQSNDLTIGLQNVNLLSHPNTILAPKARQARDSSENSNYETQAPKARPSGEMFNFALSL